MLRIYLVEMAAELGTDSRMPTGSTHCTTQLNLKCSVFKSLPNPLTVIMS